MIVICLVGFQGSGKTLVGKNFENALYVTDIVRKFLEKKKITLDDEITKDTYYLNLYKKENILTKHIIDKLLLQSKNNPAYIFVDDIKTKSQIKELKKYFSVKIVSIEAHKKDRIKRLSELGFEISKIFQWEEYLFDIRILQNQADYRVLNYGNLKKFSADINEMKNSWLINI